MGRQGPRLVPFLKNGLSNKKYRNLISEDPLCLTFSIVLPHKTKKLDAKDEFIFKDWYALNGKRYNFGSKHYTDARQALTASLRKSDYVEKVHISDNRLTYRILSKAEVLEKKRLKKEEKNKKNIEKKASDSEDVSSGYGSGGDSPRNDYSLLLNDNLMILGINESPQVCNLKEANSLLEINDMQPNTCFANYDIVPKPEPMDVDIPGDKYLVTNDTPILLESDLLTLQSFESNLTTADYFPKKTEHDLYGLDSRECSFESLISNSSAFTENFPAGNEYLLPDGLFNGEVNNFENDAVAIDSIPALAREENFSYQVAEKQNILDLNADNISENENLLPTDGLFNGDMNNLGNDAVAIDLNPAITRKENCCNQVAETQNMPELPTDGIGEEFWKLIEEVMTEESQSPIPLEGSNGEQSLPVVDACLPDQEKEFEKFYLCKKCIHLGKIPILFCEPQFPTSTTSKKCSEIKIAFEETVLKEIGGFKGIKEHKFINDHLMVILEPSDE